MAFPRRAAPAEPTRGEAPAGAAAGPQNQRLPKKVAAARAVRIAFRSDAVVAVLKSGPAPQPRGLAVDAAATPPRTRVLPQRSPVAAVAPPAAVWNVGPAAVVGVRLAARAKTTARSNRDAERSPSKWTGSESCRSALPPPWLLQDRQATAHACLVSSEILRITDSPALRWIRAPVRLLAVPRSVLAFCVPVWTLPCNGRPQWWP